MVVTVSQRPILEQGLYPELPQIPPDHIIWLLEPILGDVQLEGVLSATITACAHVGEWRAVELVEVRRIMQAQEIYDTLAPDIKRAALQLEQAEQATIFAYEGEEFIALKPSLVEAVLKGNWMPLKGSFHG